MAAMERATESMMDLRELAGQMSITLWSVFILNRMNPLAPGLLRSTQESYGECHVRLLVTVVSTFQRLLTF